jgi:hypothetical protein
MELGVGFPVHCDHYVVYCSSPIEFQISRHTLSALVLWWYLLASPLLPEADGTKPLHLLQELEAMFGREMADNFAQRPSWGLRFFNVQ